MNNLPRAASPMLVLIVGPIASGKSTVARALTTQLRRDSEQVALVELDQIAEMALPTLPSWDSAHAIFDSVVAQWLRTALTIVVAEGPGTQDEVDDLVTQIPPGIVVVTAALTSPFEVAFSRAEADATRGISRERQFLSGIFQQWSQDLPHIERDVLIDTGRSSVVECVRAIRSTISVQGTSGGVACRNDLVQ